VHNEVLLDHMSAALEEEALTDAESQARRIEAPRQDALAVPAPFRPRLNPFLPLSNLARKRPIGCLTIAETYAHAPEFVRNDVRRIVHLCDCHSAWPEIWISISLAPSINAAGSTLFFFAS
jgi:hypothetical protein